MHLSKLITTLQVFDEATFKSLRDYVRSPFFKVPTGSATLFEYLSPLYPRFPESKVNPKSIEVISPNLSTPAKQARAGSELLEAVEEFLAVRQWQKNKRGQTFSKLQAFQELQMVPQFAKGYETEMESLQNCPEQDVNTFFYRHLLIELSFNGFDAKLDRTSQNDINPLLQSFDEYAALKKLRYLCEALSRKQVLGTAYDEAAATALFKTLEPNINEHYPYVYLFANVYRMMEESSYAESDLYYRFIKQYAAKNSFDRSPQSLTEVNAYAINYCLKWFNKGYEAAGDEYLWWMEWKMKYDLLLENGKMLPITFRNIISIAVLNKKNPDWMEKVIKTYAQYLPEEHHETNLAFAQGLHQYALKNHKEAIRYFLLAQAKEEVIFNSIIRRWQWMSLYECDPTDTDTLLNHLLAFEKYLLRYKDEMQHLSGVFTTFISYANKLLKANKREAEIVLQELTTTENFPGSSWLIEQLDRKNNNGKRTARQLDVA